MQRTQDISQILADGVELVRRAKRAQHRMDEWFLVQEIKMEQREAMCAEGLNPDDALGQARLLRRVAEKMPLSILPGTAIAGSQDGAFSPSYALINPSFKVESFAGYCDPTAIYDDIVPCESLGITQERIDCVRSYWANTSFVNRLHDVYQRTGEETREVVYFVEPVTGHTIPDMRPCLAEGIRTIQARSRSLGDVQGEAMTEALEAAVVLAQRYRALALQLADERDDPAECLRLKNMAEVLGHVPAQGARSLHDAIQSFTLLWQVMALEQAPNPYAFSVGNLDRVLQPYYDPAQCSHGEAVGLLRNLLCFLQVGARCWAISQNIIIGGRDEHGRDLTVGMTEVVLDAFFDTNDPQPALSVKVHAGTPQKLYESLGRFFFTPGHLTPSLFNDDTMFELLRRQGVAESDLPDYAIAGCQEPLVMGKSSLNTTNTWLNLGKVLEITCNDGRSLVTGKAIGPTWQALGYANAEHVFTNLEEVFWKYLDFFLSRMRDSGNTCTVLLGEEKPVPFTSAVMDSFATRCDLRDPARPGARYHGSGCLIHGLSVVADSLLATRRALDTDRWSGTQIQEAMLTDYESASQLRQFLLGQDKFGNNLEEVDSIAARLIRQVSERVSALINSAGSHYLADWSTPSTHLLYGYWVGATPDGRKARTMLGYGVDPRPEVTRRPLPERIKSAWKLPYFLMTGGYASHIGINPREAEGAQTFEAKGCWMRDRVISPLFRLGQSVEQAPYYVYLNVDDCDHLRRVLADPKKYAPSGVYIMRIHGTFVNFLDLSPAIQEDIMERLEAGHLVT